MTKCLMRVVEFANGAPCKIAGQWLQSFDHNGANGRGDGVFTDKPHEAMTFADKGEALAFWGMQSTVRPRRPDGKPNKPLTATTVVIEPLDAVLRNEKVSR